MGAVLSVFLDPLRNRATPNFLVPLPMLGYVMPYVFLVTLLTSLQYLLQVRYNLVVL